MKLRIRLRSDSAFGRGDGIAGLVDSEIEYDARTGFPYIKGRTIKGLLVESCADILYALSNHSEYGDFVKSAGYIFGSPGSTQDTNGALHIGKAELPEDFRQFVLAKNHTEQQILQAFTTIRHQTAIDVTSEKAKIGSLRATRLVLRETIFYVQLHEIKALGERDIKLLAACVAGVKRGGQNRTRGCGWLDTSLVEVNGHDDGNPLKAFIHEIGGVA